MRMVEFFNGNFITNAINHYNLCGKGPKFNVAYNHFIHCRVSGIEGCSASLQEWLATQTAAQDIWGLLDSYGMNSRGSSLKPVHELHATLKFIANTVRLDKIAVYRIPTGGLTQMLPSGSTLGAELQKAFELLRIPNRVSKAGGFVAASKALHCILPDLVPMLDRSHIALSLYKIDRDDYLPPGGDWNHYLGFPAPDTPNPSPRGAGANAWQGSQLLCAIGFYERIYEEWQVRNNQSGLSSFLALDKTPGTTGVPRVIDKILW